MKKLIPAALLLASCGQSGSPNVRIADAWARETVAGQSSAAAYLTLTNSGSRDDRLDSIAAAPPATASLHTSENSGGVARMRELSSGLAVPAGSTIELKPGGPHIMIMGPGAPLRTGEVLKLRLRFEKSGEKPVDVRIVPATGPES